MRRAVSIRGFVSGFCSFSVHLSLHPLRFLAQSVLQFCSSHYTVLRSYTHRMYAHRIAPHRSPSSGIPKLTAPLPFVRLTTASMYPYSYTTPTYASRFPSPHPHLTIISPLGFPSVLTNTQYIYCNATKSEIGSFITYTNYIAVSAAVI